MKAYYYSLSDKGTTREHNEDSYLNNEKYSLFMLADGMGGYQSGDVASKVALTSILSYIEHFSKDSAIFSENAFKDAIQFANRNIYNLKNVDTGIKTIGSTLVCFLPGETEGVAFNIGDSRLYQFSNKKLTQITSDHNAEDKLPDFMKGLGGGKFSGMISRALGVHKTVEIDRFSFNYNLGDILLLCSDGLYSMVTDEEICKMLDKKESLKVKCEKFINLANKNGGEDNITVTLVRIDSVEDINNFEMIVDN